MTKHFLFITLISLLGCSNTIDGTAHLVVDSSTHTIEISNPIIQWCQTLYPEILYPNEVERQTNIVECMQICSESGQCSVEIPQLPQDTQLPQF
jgi:hypothetical protein